MKAISKRRSLLQRTVGNAKATLFSLKGLKSLSHSLLALLDDLLTSHGVQAATALFANDFEPTKNRETRCWAFNPNTFTTVVPRGVRVFLYQSDVV